MRILVLEDELSARLLLQKILSEFGKVDVTTDGLEALEAFELAIDSTVSYDLVCLDIMVPELDGLEVLRRMRRIESGIDKENPKRTVRIVMISALTDPENQLAAYKSHCDGYIFKPFSKEKIVKTLKQLGLLE